MSRLKFFSKCAVTKMSIAAICLVIFVCPAISQAVLVADVQEFDNAVTSAVPGSTIILKNGEWRDVELDFVTNGTVEDSITVMAQTPGEVVLTGSSKINLAGEYLIVKNLDFNGGYSNGDAIISFRKSSSQLANHSRVTNCRILDYNPSSDDVNYKWVSIYGEYNRVDHCSFEGKNHEGALLVVWLSGSPNYHRIDHNYFANIPELGRNGGETIRIGTSTNSLTESWSTVEYNLFEACDGEIEIISNKSEFNVYRYNTFRDNEGTLTLRHGNDCEVYGNFFFGGEKNSGGVRIIGERHKVYNNYFEGLNGTGFRATISMVNGVPDSPLNRYFQVQDAVVVHNTIVSCKEPIAIGEGADEERSLPPVNCIVANNIIDKTTGGQAVIYTDVPVDFTYASNISNGNVGITEDGFIQQNPPLVQENGLWKLSQSSPAINNAVTYDFVTADMDGQTRDASPDIGSDEFSAMPISNRPLTREDVGYSWEIEVDNSVLATSYDPNIRLKVSNNALRIVGADESNYPIRVLVFNLEGKTLLDRVTPTDTIETKSISDQTIIVLLTDKRDRLISKNKIRISSQ